MVGEEECLYVVGLSGGPKRTRGGAGTWGVVQGIRNPSVFPQDRELRPEEIEGKGLGKELEFPGWGALGGRGWVLGGLGVWGQQLQTVP